MLDKSPDAFRTISEVAEELNLPQHVLRFWETRFSQIKPMKRAGGRRYYRPDDFDLLQGIRHLLYDQGYTIKGVQKLLKQNGNKYVIAIGAGDTQTVEAILAAKEQESQPALALAGAEEVGKVLGQAKLPVSRRFFPRKNADNGDVAVVRQTDGKNAALHEEDRALLQEALYDLLECKRLLDQTR
ncbi:MerR family transcriptional regulator [Lentilitoribacter sp. EG35]|uniref:MerR family transcriptional regulator n=1 Tax=Lentilitoribacter sp. EG35 TaxID=3234192 RepID=UPI003B969086